MDTKWLSDLEKKVETTVKTLEALRKENASQKRKVKQLQRQLDDAQSAEKSAGSWEVERQEIRQRVEKLSAGLEKLL